MNKKHSEFLDVPTWLYKDMRDAIQCVIDDHIQHGAISAGTIQFVHYVWTKLTDDNITTVPRVE